VSDTLVFVIRAVSGVDVGRVVALPDSRHVVTFFDTDEVKVIVDRKDTLVYVNTMSPHATLEAEPAVRAAPVLSKERVQEEIARTCNTLRDLLLEKNECYGNSTLDPENIFSKAPPLEGIRVRIDDKLKRLKHGREYAGDDTYKDLAGYLILYLVGRQLGVEG
jgi:hypothetical protein